MSDETSTGLREHVRARYADAARAVLGPRPGMTASCCESSATAQCCGTGPAALDPAGCFGGSLYREGETDGLPQEAALASLGCGNPPAVMDLHALTWVDGAGAGGTPAVLPGRARPRISMRGRSLPGPEARKIA